MPRVSGAIFCFHSFCSWFLAVAEFLRKKWYNTSLFEHINYWIFHVWKPSVLNAYPAVWKSKRVQKYIQPSPDPNPSNSSIQGSRLTKNFLNTKHVLFFLEKVSEPTKPRFFVPIPSQALAGTLPRPHFSPRRFRSLKAGHSYESSREWNLHLT